MRFYALLAAPLLLAVPATAQVVQATLTAQPSAVELAPGVVENAWTFNGTIPGPTLRITEGERLRVRFRNELPETSIVHIHGQPVHLGMDGVPGISRPETATGQEFLYDFENLKPGTYWYHPHSTNHHQLDRGLYGALIVDPANPAADPPFDAEHEVVLDEWTSPLGGAGFRGHLLNGKSSDGQSAIPAQLGQRLRLRFVNASAITNYVVALDGHTFEVTHSDGYRVQSVTVPALVLGIGERYDVIVDCNNPGVWSLAVAAFTNRSATLVRGVLRYAGQSGPDPSPSYVPPALASGPTIDYAQLAAFTPGQPLVANPARRYTGVLGMRTGPGGLEWTINNEAWPNVTPWLVAKDEIVEITWQNTTPSSMHLHPMHLHGHSFRLAGTAGGSIAPPIKDTVLLRPSGQPGDQMTIQFTADNPGSWLVHCHHLTHMARGMMTLVDYIGDADADGLPDSADKDPTFDRPVLTISEDANQFAIGQSGALGLEWRPQSTGIVFFSLGELVTPLHCPPFGELELDPLSLWPGFTYGPSSTTQTSIPYTIPNDPSLRDGRFVMQALASTSTPGSARLSSAQAFTIR